MGLRVLSLDNNSFTGPILESLGNLSSPYYLEIAFNQIEGAIPSNLSYITSMRYLTLVFNKLSAGWSGVAKVIEGWAKRRSWSRTLLCM
jgi:Leucine-rich repeat (LRR) protein